MSLLQVAQLCVHYGDVAAVNNLSFAIAAGESVGMVGESGSGKTQTGLAIMGLLSSAATVSGSIRFAGQEILGTDEATLDRFARGADGDGLSGPDASVEPVRQSWAATFTHSCSARPRGRQRCR